VGLAACFAGARNGPADEDELGAIAQPRGGACDDAVLAGTARSDDEDERTVDRHR
jgi:hypothetical protein